MWCVNNKVHLPNKKQKNPFFVSKIYKLTIDMIN